MSRPRRFAIVCPNFFPRTCGVGDNSLRLGQELLRRGHEVAIFTRAPAERHPEAPDLPVHGAPHRLPSAIALSLRAQIAAYRPTDLIVQFTNQMWDAWRFGSGAPELLAADRRHAGARVLTIVHEPYIPPSRRPDLAVAYACQRVLFAGMLAASNAVRMTTNTRARTVAEICRLLRLPEPGVLRIGPSALPAARRRPPFDGRAPRLGYFSTAAVGKRFDVVLGAFDTISREIPDAELVLMGDLGPPEHPNVRVVRDTIDRHPARARIRLTGKLTLAEIAREIADLDLYLFGMNTGANSRSSTLPTALGSGLPVIAISGAETDLELFHDGENVIFATGLTGEAFAQAALPALRDRDRLARVGAGAKRLYDQQMSWDRIGDAVLDACAVA
jgi:glycosyltransferase involved in cell wall biosynthesis